MARPPLTDEPLYRLNVRVTASMYDKICAIASRHGVSMATVVRTMLSLRTQNPPNDIPHRKMVESESLDHDARTPTP